MSDTPGGPSFAADYLLRILTALAEDERLRAALGENPLSRLVLRVQDDGLVVEPTLETETSDEILAAISDAVSDALGRAEAPAGSVLLPPGLSRPSAGIGPHLIAARSHLNSGNPGRALAIIEGALKRWPDNVELCTYHAVTLAALGHLEQGVAAYERVLELSPRSIFALSGAAQLLIRLGRWRAARRYVDRGLELRADDPSLLHLLALCYEHAREYEAAEETLKQALKADPDLHGAMGDLQRIRTSRRVFEEVEFVDDEDEEKEPEIVLDAADIAPAMASPVPSVETTCGDHGASWARAARSPVPADSVPCPDCGELNPRPTAFCIKCGCRMRR
ncbi:MAG: tetratricopeptide repeat protein [Armatimonadetes bacterium]|nr:tetratricopeptide repeat protein [Armatimonadota bacterium]